MKHSPSYSKSLNNVKSSIAVMKASIFFLAVFLYSCTSNEKQQVSAPEAPALPVIAVNSSSETTYLKYPASIEGAVDLEIRPQVSGTLERIYVNEGALVNKGQPLFKINELPFREALNNAQALLQSAEAAAINAQLEVDKLTPLVANQVVSEFQLKSAKAAYRMAKANVEQARAGVAAARINLGYTLIKAPINGYVGRLPKKQGSLVSQEDPIPLTELSDASEVHAYFSLSEDDFIDFNKNYPGKTVAERIKNIPGVSLLLADFSVYPQQGKLDMIDGQFDKGTGAITLRATFPNHSGVLRSGNTGKIRLNLTHQNALTVPQESTVELQDKVFVFSVDKNNKVTKQPITVIGTSGKNYLVKDGLRAGDRIVFKGIEVLKDGDSIQPEKSKGFTAANISK